MTESSIKFVNISSKYKRDEYYKYLRTCGHIKKLYIAPDYEFGRVTYSNADEAYKACMELNNKPPFCLHFLIPKNFELNNNNTMVDDSNNAASNSDFVASYSNQYVDVFGNSVDVYDTEDGNVYVPLEGLKKMGIELFQSEDVDKLKQAEQSNITKQQILYFESYMKCKAKQFMIDNKLCINDKLVEDTIKRETNEYFVKSRSNQPHNNKCEASSSKTKNDAETNPKEESQKVVFNFESLNLNGQETTNNKFNQKDQTGKPTTPKPTRKSELVFNWSLGKSTEMKMGKARTLPNKSEGTQKSYFKQNKFDLKLSTDTGASNTTQQNSHKNEPKAQDIVPNKQQVLRKLDKELSSDLAKINEFKAVNKSEQTKDDSIRCLCKINKDFVHMELVMCWRCLTFQHCACLGYLYKTNIPDDYFCQLCNFDFLLTATQEENKQRMSIYRLITAYAYFTKKFPMDVLNVVPPDMKASWINSLKFVKIFTIVDDEFVIDMKLMVDFLKKHFKDAKAEEKINKHIT